MDGILLCLSISHERLSYRQPTEAIFATAGSRGHVRGWSILDHFVFHGLLVVSEVKLHRNKKNATVCQVQSWHVIGRQSKSTQMTIFCNKTGKKNDH